jgi:hypothetical protein
MSPEESRDLVTMPEPAATAPPPAPAPSYAYAPPPADARLYRFLWCALACALGTLMPFTTENPEWKPDVFNRAIRGPLGFETFYGALIGFFSLVVAAQYAWCIKYRKVKIWPLIIMLPIVVSAWFVAVQGLQARLSFDWKYKDTAHVVSSVPGAAWADIRFWNSLFTHVG